MWQHTIEEAKEISQGFDQESINKKFSEMVIECMGYTACGKTHQAIILTMWKNGAECLEGYNYSNTCNVPERLEDIKLMCPNISIDCSHINNTDL